MYAAFGDGVPLEDRALTGRALALANITARLPHLRSFVLRAWEHVGTIGMYVCYVALSVSAYSPMLALATNPIVQLKKGLTNARQQTSIRRLGSVHTTL